jgi:predicted ATPase
LTGLIGRESELAQLETLLASSRLVCLTGAGGVGKTRLAIEAAERLGGGFADGVIFVDLAPVTDARAVPATVARTLGIRDDSELSLEQRLINALRARQLLLVLDNFEQVLAAVGWVLELLHSAPGLTVLVEVAP